MRDFKTLEIWKRSVILAKNINELTEQFPTREKFALAVQMSKSAVSISSNIAEEEPLQTLNNSSILLSVPLSN